MFQLFLTLHFLNCVELQPAFFLCCSYILGKPQPDVSYKCCFYNKGCRQAIKECQYVMALQAKSPLFSLTALFLPKIT